MTDACRTIGPTPPLPARLPPAATVATSARPPSSASLPSAAPSAPSRPPPRRSPAVSRPRPPPLPRLRHKC